jgi:hypothetical protein
LQRLCDERGLQLVCIQPLASHIARQQQDYTTHKTDEADCRRWVVERTFGWLML